MKPRRYDFMPRQARLDSPGTLHHVIVRGKEKRMVSRFGDISEETKTSVYGWTVFGWKSPFPEDAISKLSIRGDVRSYYFD